MRRWPWGIVAAALAPTASWAAARSDKPWGEPVSSLDTEKRVVSLLDSLSKGKVEGTVVLSPGLWGRVKSDAKLADLGIPLWARTTINGKQLVLEGRGFSPPHGLDAAAKRESFRGVGTWVPNGKTRSANDAERETFYSVISFEIKGEPVTIVSDGKQRLLVFIMEDKERGAMLWIEDLDALDALLH
jgi:hypothetical protein